MSYRWSFWWRKQWCIIQIAHLVPLKSHLLFNWPRRTKWINFFFKGLTGRSHFWNTLLGCRVYGILFCVSAFKKTDSCENRRFFALLGPQREIATNDLMDHFFAFYQRVIMAFFFLWGVNLLPLTSWETSFLKKKTSEINSRTNLQ